MQIIGHRGARDIAPENTIAGFKEALRFKPDWIELDVRVSRDGIPFVVHDPIMGRLAEDWRFVARLTAAQLKALPMRRGEPLATLDEALAVLLPKCKVLIEVKTRAAAEPTAKIVNAWLKKGEASDRFLLQSFWPHVLRRIHQVAPELPLSLILHALPLRFTAVGKLPLKAVGFYHRILPRRVFEIAKRRGLWVYAHTVDDPLEAKKLEGWGIDAIVTNRPDLFKG